MLTDKKNISPLLGTGSTLCMEKRQVLKAVDDGELVNACKLILLLDRPSFAKQKKIIPYVANDLFL